MRIRKLLFGAVAFLIFIPSAAWTSGPVVVNEAGQPLVWDLTGGPVPFNPDQGGLGRLDNAAAIALVAGNFAIWDTIPGCQRDCPQRGQPSGGRCLERLGCPLRR